MRWHGDKTFAELLPRLSCMFCRQRPTFLSLAPNIVRDAGDTQGATWSLVLMTGCGE